MIGRAPMMMQPQFISPPMQSYPGPQPGQMQASQPWPPPPQRQQAQPAPAAPQAAAQQPQPKPLTVLAQQPIQPIIVRGQRPDEPAAEVAPINSARPAPLTLPSPEQLGVTAQPRPQVAAVPVKVDWNMLHERLEHLGGTGFQLVQLPDGRARVGFVLRTNRADQVHHVEATAATQAEAASLAMNEAEQWAASPP